MLHPTANCGRVLVALTCVMLGFDLYSTTTTYPSGPTNASATTPSGPTNASATTPSGPTNAPATPAAAGGGNSTNNGTNNSTKGPTSAEIQAYINIGPVAKMPFSLYFFWTKACKKKHKIPAVVTDKDIDVMWNCTFNPWFKAIELCENDYYAKFPSQIPQVKPFYRLLSDQPPANGNKSSYSSVGSENLTGNGTGMMSVEGRSGEALVAEIWEFAKPRVHLLKQHVEEHINGTIPPFVFVNDRVVTYAPPVQSEPPLYFSTVFPRVPRAVLDCALNRSGYNPDIASELRTSMVPIYVTILQLFWALEF